MPERVAEFVWLVIAGYGGFGLLVALALAFAGMRRLHPSAANAPLRVRLLMAPGMAALWPLMLARVFGARPREDRQ